jgi:hypothetical protein
MPFYVYVDRNTGEKFELMMTISEMMRRQKPDGTIKHDGRTLHRSIAAEHHGVSSTPGNWPMRSDAAGVHPSQTGEAYSESVKLGVPTRFDPQTGQAIFESRSHRRDFLKAKGMFDRSGGYGD